MKNWIYIFGAILAISGCAKLQPNTENQTVANSNTQGPLMSSAKDFTAFNILGQAGTIGTNTVDVTVPFGTNVTTLVATFTTTGASVNISGTNQVSGTTANNFTTPRVYTVVAADGSTKSYTVTVTVAANNAKDITAFSILGQAGTIGTNAINVTVPFGTNVTTLVATFTTTGASVNISGTNQVSGTTANNFTTARVYTVVAADASTKNYTVTVTVAANTAKDITAFSILGQSGTIGAGTIDITVPFGTNVTALVATFTITGASVNISGTNQASGTTANNFTTSKTYTVVAADSSTKNYTVTVTVAAPSATKDFTSFQILGQTGTIGSNTISLTVPYGTNRTNLVATFTINGSNVHISGVNQISGTTANDFTTSKVYTIVAQDSSTKTYTVTVSEAACSPSLMGGASANCTLSLSAAVSTIAGPAQGSITSGDTDGTGNSARFQTGTGLTTDGTNLYLADTSNNKIRKIVIASGVVTTLAGPAEGTITAGDTDGTGNAARFNNVQGITTDGTNLYVADTGNNKIRKIVISTGVVTTIAGPAQGCYPSCPSGDADGTGNAARFLSPIGIVTNGAVLYVTGNNKIRRITISTRAVMTYAGPAPGSSTAGDIDATGNAARFFNPVGITIAGTSLYVAEWNGNKIRRINLATAAVTTLVGPAQGCYSTCPSGDTDGTGTVVRTYNSRGLTNDGTYLYLADAGNQKIRQIAIATGVTTTLAGPATGCYIGCAFGDTDAVGNAARFRNPYGITTDGINLYVSDSAGNKVRKIQ